MNKLKENFKEILILVLIVLIIVTNGYWCYVHTKFINGYFWSDYNVLNSNTNINENINDKGDE